MEVREVSENGLPLGEDLVTCRVEGAKFRLRLSHRSEILEKVGLRREADVPRPRTSMTTKNTVAKDRQKYIREGYARFGPFRVFPPEP